MGLLQKYASDVLRHVVGGELAEGRFSRRQSGMEVVKATDTFTVSSFNRRG